MQARVTPRGAFHASGRNNLKMEFGSPGRRTGDGLRWSLSGFRSPRRAAKPSTVNDQRVVRRVQGKTAEGDWQKDGWRAARPIVLKFA